MASVSWLMGGAQRHGELTRRTLLQTALASVAVALFRKRSGAAEVTRPDRVVLVVVDGIRKTEWAYSQGTELAPRFHTFLRPAGRFLDNVQVTAETWTYPAHETLLTGTPHLAPRTMETEHVSPEVPTLMEAWRASFGTTDSKVRLVAGKMFFQGLASSTHPSWGPSFGTRPNHDLREGRWLDAVMWDEVDRVLSEDRPDLLIVNAADVDEIAHIGDLDAYRASIARFDIHLHRLWERIRWDPAYAGRTLFLVTTDHGRHLDGTGLGPMTHGDSCGGCRTAFLYAYGPNVPPDTLDNEIFDQTSIAPTIARLVGFPLPMAWGPPLPERLVEAEAVPVASEPDFSDATGADLTGDTYDDVIGHDVVAWDGIAALGFVARVGDRFSLCTRMFSDLATHSEIVTLVENAQGMAWPHIHVDADGSLVVFVLIYTASRWDWWQFRSSDGSTWDSGSLIPMQTNTDAVQNPWDGRFVLIDTRWVFVGTNLGGFAVVAREPEGDDDFWEAKYLGGGSKTTWNCLDACADPSLSGSLLVFASRYRDEGREAGQSAWFGRIRDVLTASFEESPTDLETITEWNTSPATPVEVRHPRVIDTGTGGVHVAWSQRQYDESWSAGFGEGATPEISSMSWLAFDATRPSLARGSAGSHVAYLDHAPRAAGVAFRSKQDGKSWGTAVELVPPSELCDEPRIVGLESAVYVTFRMWRDGQWRVRVVKT